MRIRPPQMDYNENYTLGQSSTRIHDMHRVHAERVESVSLTNSDKNTVIS